MKTMVSFKEAYQSIVESNIPQMGEEKVIFSNALDRVLSEPIYAPEHQPQAPVSSMDGFAFCFEDLEHLRTHGLAIMGDNPAGNTPLKLEKNCAIKTFTGALMPQGSDTLIIVESTLIKDNRLYLKEDAALPKKGEWVRQIGENYQKGELLLEKNQKLTPYEIALLAELNRVCVQVRQKPKVGILISGSEIIEVGEARAHLGQVRSVNNHLLSAMVQKMGGTPIIYANTKDDRASLEAVFGRMLEECDALITTGGMSMGDYDFTQEVIEARAKVVFKKVRIKPGKPMLFALDKARGKPILGLSGNPNAVAITFYIFGGCMLAKMLGLPTELATHRAILRESIERADSRLEFRSCEIELHEGRYYASFARKKPNQSAIINNLCAKSALAILSEESLSAGEEVEIILFKEFVW